MDPPIKLFGQTIALPTLTSSSQDGPPDGPGTKNSAAGEQLSSSPIKDVDQNRVENVSTSDMVTASSCPTLSIAEPSSSGSNGDREESPSPASVELRSRGGSPVVGDVGNKVIAESDDLDGEDAGLGMEGFEDDDGGGKGSKMLKRPDKIVDCPRCHSADTKFCYYNNYNVNQPRHFCKNCQRYWTAGGTLRNVPVGAGRRKNKHGAVISSRPTPEVGLVRGEETEIAAPILAGGKSVALPVPMLAPEAQNAMAVPVGCSASPMMRVPVVANSSDTSGVPYAIQVPLSESTYIITSPEGAQLGDINMMSASVSPDATFGIKEIDGGSSWAARDEAAFAGVFPSAVKGEPGAVPEHRMEGDMAVSWGNGAGVPPYGFYNGGWPYGYNVGWNGSAAVCAGGMPSGGINGAPPLQANMAAWSGPAPSGTMWGGMPWPMPGVAWSPAGWCPPWSMGPWGMSAPVAGSTLSMGPPHPLSGPSVSQVPRPAGAVPVSPLGKHERTIEAGGPILWTPKSLRMGDPEEAMRSSVWRILGGGSGLDLATSSTYDAFQPRQEFRKGFVDDQQQAAQATMQANPAAMSRSIFLQEAS